MNTFYKEQKTLMRKATSILCTIEAVEEVRDESPKDEFCSSHFSKRLDALQTDYALTVTTLMQNFCAELGFTLIRTNPDHKELERLELIKEALSL